MTSVVLKTMKMTHTAVKNHPTGTERAHEFKFYFQLFVIYECHIFHHKFNTIIELLACECKYYF